jgi:hypothetical protein
MLKKCTKCGIEKELNFFSKDKHKKDGLKSSCRDCYKIDHLRRYANDPEGQRKRIQDYRTKLRVINPEKLSLSNRNTKLKKAYGLSVKSVEEMKEKQNYCCFICKKHESIIKGRGLVVDHDHTTGEVRKLLCTSCNTALGLLKEDTSTLVSMIQYISSYKAVPA